MRGKLIVGATSPSGPADRFVLPRRATSSRALLRVVRPHDLVLTLGAGDVVHAGEQLLATLAGQGKRRPAPNSLG